MAKRHFLLLCAVGLVLLAVVGTLGYPQYERWRAERRARAAYEAALNKAPTPHPLTSALRSAPSVIAYRLDERKTGNKWEFVPRPDGRNLALPEQKRLADALDKVDFNPLIYKACAFVPGVEFRFMAGKDAVALRVCFHCNDLAYFGSGGQASKTVDFWRVNSELREIATKAFPEILGESKR